jgi:heptaprenyl diphosphate synthase
MTMASTLVSADIGRVRSTAVPSRSVATGSAFLAVACVLGLVEASLPTLPLAPWLHLGLANVAVVMALALHGVRTAAVVSFGRVVVVGLAAGSLASPAFGMAAAGAAASLGSMWALSSRAKSISVVGWSAAGSAAHMVAQFLVSTFILGSGAVLVLAPPSVLLALVFGTFVGSLARLLISRLSVS